MTLVKVNCVHCNKEGNNESFLPVVLCDRGKRYFCPECASEMGSYYEEGYGVRNQSKNHGFTVGFEMELTRDSIEARTLMIRGFIPTYDCTVKVEMKSPVFLSWNGIRKLLLAWDLGLDVRFFGEDAGTHIHIGHETIGELEIGRIADRYNAIYQELSDFLDGNPELTTKIFGRPLGDWCEPINEYSRAYAHANFINLEHKQTIEYRFPKFNHGEASQFVDATQICRSLTEVVITNYLNHFGKDKIDTTRYANMDAYLDKKASVTAKKLVGVITKYADKKGWAYIK